MIELVAGNLCIVVMRDCFVLVGRVQPCADALFLRLERAAIVRRWGTTAGLGQLAKEGPKPNTKLDPEGDVVINKLEVSRILTCDESRWPE